MTQQNDRNKDKKPQDGQSSPSRDGQQGGQNSPGRDNQQGGQNSPGRTDQGQGGQRTQGGDRRDDQKK
mgnify:CR=1 FL=1